MTAEQSLAMAISIVLCVCFTINSVILVQDFFFQEDLVKYHEPQQFGLALRVTTMLVMWVVWLIIIFGLTPWSKSSDNSVDKVEQKQEQSLEINLPT